MVFCKAIIKLIQTSIEHKINKNNCMNTTFHVIHGPTVKPSF